MTGEVYVSQIAPGDSVFHDGAIQIVRARVNVSNPPRTILIFEDGTSISLQESDLINRTDSGASIANYEGPSWVCGMPEKIDVSSVESGDLVLEPNVEVVRATINTSNGWVLVTHGVLEPQTSHVRFHGRNSHLRVIAKGLGVRPWNGTTEVAKDAVEVLAGDLPTPTEVVLDVGVVSVDSTTTEGNAIYFELSDGSRLERSQGEPTVHLHPISQSDPDRLGQTHNPISYTCPNGHVSTSERPLNTGQRFTDCPTCGLPATTGGGTGVPAPSALPVAKFCGSCGRVRNPDHAFCTGCGKRYSRLDTTGFRS